MVGVHRIARKGLYLGSEAAELNSQVYWRKQSRRRDWRFLEDVGEYTYNIDRMMYQLKRSGKLSKLGGLIIGGFTGMKDTERPFGSTVYECIRDVVGEYDYPVCFDFPVSHEKENYALKIGVGYKLKVTKSKVILEE